MLVLRDGQRKEDAGEETPIKLPRFDPIARRFDERAKEADSATTRAATSGERTRNEVVSSTVAFLRIFIRLLVFGRIDEVVLVPRT